MSGDIDLSGPVRLLSSAFEPRVFELTFQFGARHIIWNADKRELIWGPGSGPSRDTGPKQTLWNKLARVSRSAGETHPSEEEWITFWTILDKIDVWAWRDDYDSHIWDGGPWCLTIAYGNRSLKSRGNLAGEWPPRWDLLERSVDALAGIAHLRTNHFPKVVENLNDLLRLANIAEAAHHRPTEAVPTLMQYLQEGGIAGQTLVDISAAIAPVARDFVPEVIKALKIGDERSFWAVQVLARIGPTTTAAAPALCEVLLKDPLTESDCLLSSEAASALGQIGPGTEGVLATLIEALKHRNPGVRKRAAYALGRVGHAAESSVAGLTEALTDVDGDVRKTVREALKRIRGESR